MKVLRFINDKLEEIFLVVLMSIAVLLVAMQVATRFAGIPLPWSEEVARYIFLWLVWVGAAYATKERKHISIDFLVSRMPQLGQKLCAVLVMVIWILFVIFMIYVSVILTAKVYEGGSVATGSGTPMWLPYASIPVGMCLMLFRLIQNLIIDLKGSKGEGGEVANG